MSGLVSVLIAKHWCPWQAVTRAGGRVVVPPAAPSQRLGRRTRRRRGLTTVRNSTALDKPGGGGRDRGDMHGSSEET